MAIVGNDPHLKRVWRYYDRTESRIGYTYLLHGTKHFGWYKPGQSMWEFTKAMHQMEYELGKRLSLPPEAVVLDAGCGTGAVARTMATRYQLQVTGIDILDFNLEEARKRSAKAGLQDRTTFLLGDYSNLEFADESFDGVYTMETVVHAADPAVVLSEFWRVLRPGGRLVMFEYSRTPEAELSPASNAALQRVCDMGAMPTWLKMNHGDMERLLKQQHFAVESAEDVTEHMIPMLRAFSLIGRFPYFVGRVSGRTAKVVNALSGVEMYKHQDAWRYNIYVATKTT
jgi:sterol 24-C-methyltransferase